MLPLVANPVVSGANAFDSESTEKSPTSEICCSDYGSQMQKIHELMEPSLKTLSTNFPNLEEESVCSYYSSSDESATLAPSKDESVIKTQRVSKTLAAKLNVEDPGTNDRNTNTLEMIQSRTHRGGISMNEKGGRNHCRPFIVGHRGSIYMEVENTVKGLKRAADMGCDAVELDVFLLKCGTLVVFHGDGDDKNPGGLHTYCGVNASILDYTAAQAREELKFNPHAAEFVCPKEKFSDAYIPTLEEVLRVLKGTSIIVKIELKGAGTPEPVVELVDRMDMVGQCHFGSFRRDHVARVRELRPERNPDGTHKYKTGLLFTDVPENFLEIAKQVDATEVHLKYDTCTKERIEAIHSAGIGSMAWFPGPSGIKEDVTTKYTDIEHEGDVMYQTVLLTGVMSMCINKPDVLMNLLAGAAQPLISRLVA